MYLLDVPGSVLAALHLEFYLILPRTMGDIPTLAMIIVVHCTPGSLRRNMTFVFVLYRKEVEGTVIGMGPLASGGPRPKSLLLSVTQCQVLCAFISSPTRWALQDALQGLCQGSI